MTRFHGKLLGDAVQYGLLQRLNNRVLNVGATNSKGYFARVGTAEERFHLTRVLLADILDRHLGDDGEAIGTIDDTHKGIERARLEVVARWE